MTAPRVKLDIDATREKLAALGLSHAVKALEGLLSDAVRSEMPAHAILERLLDAERSGREERRVRRKCPTFCVSVIWSMLPERSKDDDDFERTAGRAAEGLQAA